jgi:hypothetical protein
MWPPWRPLLERIRNQHHSLNAMFLGLSDGVSK